MIKLKVSADKEMQKILNKNIHFLLERTNSDKIDFVDGKMPEKTVEFEIKDKKLSISFS